MRIRIMLALINTMSICKMTKPSIIKSRSPWLKMKKTDKISPAAMTELLRLVCLIFLKSLIFDQIRSMGLEDFNIHNTTNPFQQTARVFYPVFFDLAVK